MHLSTNLILRFIEEWSREHEEDLSFEEAKQILLEILLMKPDEDDKTFNRPNNDS